MPNWIILCALQLQQALMFHIPFHSLLLKEKLASFICILFAFSPKKIPLTSMYMAPSPKIHSRVVCRLFFQFRILELNKCSRCVLYESESPQNCVVPGTKLKTFSLTSA